MDNSDFIKEYNDAIASVCEKHKKELVPVFRFGESWLPAQLIVNEKSTESEADEPADTGDQGAKE